MKAIYKYPIPSRSKPTIAMHGDSPRVIMVGIDPNGNPCIWAEVDPDAELVAHDIRTFGTAPATDEPTNAWSEHKEVKMKDFPHEGTHS